jgi:hypothetical protein
MASSSSHKVRCPPTYLRDLHQEEVEAVFVTDVPLMLPMGFLLVSLVNRNALNFLSVTRESLIAPHTDELIVVGHLEDLILVGIPSKIIQLLLKERWKTTH